MRGRYSRMGFREFLEQMLAEAKAENKPSDYIEHLEDLLSYFVKVSYR